MSAPQKIRLTSVPDIVSAVPHLLGFEPVASLVLMGLHDKQLGLTVRFDLHTDYTARELAAIGKPLHANNIDRVMVVVVDDNADPRLQAQAELVDQVTDYLHGVYDIEVAVIAHTEGFAAGCRWVDGRTGDNGALDGDEGAEVAFRHVAAGRITHSCREELEQLVTPESAAQRPARIPEATQPDSARAALVALAQLTELLPDGPRTDQDYARAGWALADIHVRDAAMTWMLLDPVTASNAERLWLTLTRGCPQPWTAAPATLAAACAYLRGDGALTGIALDAALAADPDYSLAKLLHAALQAGTPPQALRTAFEGAANETTL